ncbi:MAG: 3-deoxy-D-manno-octulosonic acid transferase [Kiritimatiellae bacterium]|nr:3-deoxy-D-manno-octulosonic acid transferase [Kiritimatiellia bacterium]
MFWLLYNALFAVGFVLMLPHFLYRMARRGGYRRDFQQRFAIYSDEQIAQMQASKHIWVHAVSVGEYNVARRYMEALRERCAGFAFVLTTTTSTGYALARTRADARDQCFYFPVDFPFVVRRALDRIQPACIVLTEKELWPNLIRLAHKRGIPIMIINGQISEASFKGYRRLKPFSRRVFGYIDLILAQSDAARDAYIALGADPARVHVRGTAKYDIQMPSADIASSALDVLARAGMGDGRLLLVGGSTWPGEEAALCRSLKRLRAAGVDAGLVLVPRHAERADAVVADVEAEGLRVLRRSKIDAANVVTNPDVLLVDTTGELPAFYASATLVYIGKTLFNHGAQNMLEPALMGKPVIVGPNTENFDDVVRILLDGEGLCQVQDEAGLHDAVQALMQSESQRTTLAQKAGEVLRPRQGVVDRSVDDMLPLILTQAPSQHSDQG